MNLYLYLLERGHTATRTADCTCPVLIQNRPDRTLGLALDTNPPRLPQAGEHWRSSRAEERLRDFTHTLKEEIFLHTVKEELLSSVFIYKTLKWSYLIGFNQNHFTVTFFFFFYSTAVWNLVNQTVLLLCVYAQMIWTQLRPLHRKCIFFYLHITNIFVLFHSMQVSTFLHLTIRMHFVDSVIFWSSSRRTETFSSVWCYVSVDLFNIFGLSHCSQLFLSLKAVVERPF